MSIAIIDYGSGNLRSVQKALDKLGYCNEITSDSAKISKADAIILPGVGAFDAAIEELNAKNLVSVIKDGIKEGKPFLGLCLGMQLLFDSSEEGNETGLGLIKGKVNKFAFSDRSSPIAYRSGAESDERSAISDSRLKVPHMGWNDIKITKPSPLMKDIPDGSKVYFVHSYYCVPSESSDILTTTSYGIDFASSIQRENIFALQFHPEKSSDVGLKMLKNFAELCK